MISNKVQVLVLGLFAVSNAFPSEPVKPADGPSGPNPAAPEVKPVTKDYIKEVVSELKRLDMLKETDGCYAEISTIFGGRQWLDGVKVNEKTSIYDSVTLGYACENLCEDNAFGVADSNGIATVEGMEKVVKERIGDKSPNATKYFNSAITCLKPCLKQLEDKTLKATPVDALPSGVTLPPKYTVEKCTNNFQVAQCAWSCLQKDFGLTDKMWYEHTVALWTRDKTQDKQ